MNVVVAAGRRFEAVIGLEIHVQLSTRSKMFCACPAAYGGQPNAQVCPVCLGLPGALPVPNRGALEMAVRTALALGCHVNERSVFARKNYFYPDLPKGYQISQYDRPLAEEGSMPVGDSRGTRRIGIARLHLEEDAGKSLHGSRGDDTERTRVDLNRCGTPLVEIVTEPEFHDAEEACVFLALVRRLVRYLGISDGNMEEGSLRCDANVSVRPEGSESLGTKIEVKNMNSIRSVQRALHFEIARQVEVLTGGGAVERATMLWDEEARRAYPMRTKEEAQDYRYFPDPDLVPFSVPIDEVERLRKDLPETPWIRKERFVEAYGLSVEEAAVLTDDRAVADYFEAVVSNGTDPKAAANWVMGEMLRWMNESGRPIEAAPVSPRRLHLLVSRVDDGTISRSAAKRVFAHLSEHGGEVDAAIASLGVRQVSDEETLIRTVEEILDAHPDEVELYLRGNEALLGFFMGALMKATEGKANPQKARALVVTALKGRKG